MKHVWNISETECKSEAKLNASTTNRLRPKFCCLVGQWCVGVAGVWETSSKTLFGLEPLCTRRLQQPVQHSRQPSSATVDCQFSPLGAPRVWIFQRPWNSSDGPMRGLHISGVFHYNYKSLGRHRHYSSKLAIAESLRVSDFSDTLLHTFLSDLIWNCDIPSSIMNGTGILASLSKFLNRITTEHAGDVYVWSLDLQSLALEVISNHLQWTVPVLNYSFIQTFLY